jgi:O-methyltransferase
LEFQTAYDKIRRYDNPEFSLVTKPRCQELWDSIELVKDIEGDIIEVGVWRGGTASLIGQQIVNLNLNCKLYLADTFSGVVKTGKEDKFYFGGEHADTSLEITDSLFYNYFKFPRNFIEYLIGIFPEETSKAIEDKKFRFVHLDVDVYQSTKDAFEFLYPRLSEGAIVIFDDYEWPKCTGVTKFVNELNNKEGIELLEPKAPYHAILRKI